MNAPRILVAGVGNIFLGDDGFGVEAVAELLRGPIPENVKVRDFGIRSYDLGHAIADGYDAVIFVDATSRGGEPGTLYLVELDAPAATLAADSAVNGHSLHPAVVLRMAAALGAPLGRLFLIGCEPAVLEADDITLSEQVRGAIPAAADMVRSLVAQLISGEPINPCDSSPDAHNKVMSNECLGNSRYSDRDTPALLRGEDDSGAAAVPAYAPDVNP
ncbi:MAG TPA: hydrogenase maturation protease [Opitutaceae bacterium]|jgi:hydrogenase maturation protease|nr:hydrogenase maturation protease [Opitutaceae bacterium]